MKYTRFEDLPVWKAAVDLFLRVDSIKRHPEFRTSGDLLDQLQRAALSVSNNIAEGFESGTTQQLLTFVYYARGSAGEVRSAFRVMQRMPGFSNLKSEIADAIAAAESCSRQLRAWADSLQNSGISGQRYLTDEARAGHDRRSRAAAFIEQLNEMNRRSAEARERSHAESGIMPEASANAAHSSTGGSA